MGPRLHRDCLVWLENKADGWWYCYEDLRISAGLVGKKFGPFRTEQVAWADARGRIEGITAGGFRDAERSYTL